MKYSTTKTYILKRSIIEFGKRIFKGLTRPNQKFGADMTYGMLAAKSCLLTSIVDQLHERTKKVNAVERLGRHLCEGIPEAAKNEYHRFIRECVREAGYAQLELNVVAGNERAISMYRDMGSVELGRNPRGFNSRESGFQELMYMLLCLYRAHWSSQKGLLPFTLW